jgi:deoxyribodipyrimidine photo-lyase
MVSTEINERYRDLPWRNVPAEISAWKGGFTGYPIVDAGMRQLRETGWMHNRVRMIVGSFLVKDLLVDWRIGEAHFRQLLVDFDPSQNVGNWQWVAGTGLDAAPYHRVFNPVTQSRKFDPDGAYIRRWVPEVASLPNDAVHAPWDAGPLQLAEAGIELGRDYPEPIVAHDEARNRFLEVYKAASARDA